jgi:hypothetical protein
MSNSNTAYPGTITSFDPVTQLATVKLAMERFYNGIGTLYETIQYPILTDVPVHFPQCGSYSITFPIAVGDSCLVIFSQKGYEHWLYNNSDEIGKYSSGIPKPAYFKDHDIDDTLCIVGFNPVAKAIPNFSPTDVELRNVDRGQRITLKPNGVIEVLSQVELDLTTPTVKVVANSLVEVTAPNTNITGNVKITGELLVTGTIKSNTEVTAKTVNLSTHTHNHGPIPDA